MSEIILALFILGIMGVTVYCYDIDRGKEDGKTDL